MSNWESNLPCACCGLNMEGMVTYHHLYTRKTYPEFKNEAWNKLPCCQRHHNEIHANKLTDVAKKYTGILSFLIINKWELINGKWRRLSE